MHDAGMSWESIAAGVRFGRLVAADGWSYRFDADDLRWAVRFVMGEKESHASTEEAWMLLWTMGNRMYRVWPHYQTYAKMVQAYSIALHGEYTPRRARIQSLEPDDVPAPVIQRVIAFLEGWVQPGAATGFVHFDQCGTARSDFGPADYRSASDECYWKAEGWSGSGIWAEGPRSGSGGGIAVPVLVGSLGAALVFAWLWWSGRLR
jgi:hypothetical protein